MKKICILILLAIATNAFATDTWAINNRACSVKVNSVGWLTELCPLNYELIVPEYTDASLGGGASGVCSSNGLQNNGLQLNAALLLSVSRCHEATLEVEASIYDGFSIGQSSYVLVQGTVATVTGDFQPYSIEKFCDGSYFQMTGSRKCE